MFCHNEPTKLEIGYPVIYHKPHSSSAIVTKIALVISIRLKKRG